MLIVITDAIFLPPEYRARLEKLGDVIVYSDVPQSIGDLVSRLGRADIAIVGRCAMPGEVLEAAHNLKLVTLWRTGYDDVDIKAATRLGIVIANAPGYSDEAVAEHVFAMLLSFLRRIPEADSLVREGCFEGPALRGRELSGKTMGIIGTGRIGVRVIEIAKCLGMDVVAYDAYPSYETASRTGFRYVSLDELYRQSDFISIHMPLTWETEGFIGMDAFGKMKPSALIINTARGKIIDEYALVRALKDNRIAGACLDVFADEPPSPDNPLLKLNNVLLTPHIAYNTEEAIEACTRITVENIEQFLSGHPVNVVNPDVLPRLR